MSRDTLSGVETGVRGEGVCPPLVLLGRRGKGWTSVRRLKFTFLQYNGSLTTNKSRRVRGKRMSVFCGLWTDNEDL